MIIGTREKSRRGRHHLALILMLVFSAWLLGFASPALAGSITITKEVDWDGFTPDTSQVFEVCVNGDCKEFDYDGGQLVWDNLPDGTYTISETQPADTDEVQWQTEIADTEIEIPVCTFWLVVCLDWDYDRETTVTNTAVKKNPDLEEGCGADMASVLDESGSIRGVERPTSPNLSETARWVSCGLWWERDLK